MWMLIRQFYWRRCGLLFKTHSLSPSHRAHATAALAAVARGTPTPTPIWTLWFSVSHALMSLTPVDELVVTLAGTFAVFTVISVEVEVTAVAVVLTGATVSAILV